MANTKVTGDLIASSTIATGNIADNAVTSDKISGITTAHITEGANLYYTDARADARITAATTSDLSEGTNLYYTDARARGAVSVSGNALSYDSSTGVITSNFEESPTFTGGITATYGNYSSGVNAEYFRTAAANTNYNLITRDSTGNALFVQNSQSNANQPIANFRYGSSSVNQGTAVLQVSKDNSHFVNCNVGVGTASPAAKLSVVGSGENGGILFNNSGAQEHRFYSSANSQFNTIGSSSPIWHWAQYTGVGVAPNYKMTLNSTGLGIGTTSPESGAKLDVRAGSGGKIVLGSYDANYKIVVEGGDQLNFYNGTSATTAYINYGATGTPGNVLVSRNLFVEANSSGGVNGTIRIKSDGKVGINTTTPAFKTHIRGGSGTHETVLKIDKSSAADSGGHITILGLGVESAGWAKAGIGFERTGAYDTGKMHFLMYPTGLNTNSVGLSNSVMTINNDGFVGIGTTSPGQKLQVNGSIKIANSNSRLVFGTSGGTDRRALEGNTSGSLLQIGEGYTDIALQGNVGIGTTTPSHLLHLKSTATGATGIIIENTNNAQVLDIDFWSNAGSAQGRIRYEEGPGAFGISPNVGSPNAMYINYSNNVGIGTTLPSAKLQVQQDQTAESNVIFMNNSTGANAAIRLSLNVGNPAGDDPKISFNVGDGGLDWTMGVDNSDSDKFKISGGTDSHNPNLGTNDRLVIDASGRVEVAGNVLSIDTIDEYRQDFTTTGASTPSFDIDLKSIGASGQPFEVFVAWTHYSTSYGAGLHQAYYQRSTIQSNITLIHTYFNQTSSNGGAWSVVWLTGTEIRVQKSSGTHTGNGYGYIRVTRLKP